MKVHKNFRTVSRQGRNYITPDMAFMVEAAYFLLTLAQNLHNKMNLKTCVVTGATSGIGYEIARGLASGSHRLILIGRNERKGEEILKALRKDFNNNEVFFYQADLSLQNQIRKAGEKIRSNHPVIDVLINNAAQWTSRLEKTADGYEKQFAVNHLAYFLLTHLLYKNIAESGDGRIINIGSDSHRYGKINFQNLNLENEYHGLKAYGQSKLANLLFSYALHGLKKEENVSVYCVQPGLVKTDIGIKHTTPFHSLMWKLRRLGGITPAEAASHIIYLATSEEVRGRSGLYWDARKPKPSSKASMNIEDAAKLWKVSESMCNIDQFF